MAKDSLVGLYILGNSMQGKVVDIVDNGFYLVQLYEWFTGSASNMVLISLNDLLDYKFYSNADAWREAGSQLFNKPLRVKGVEL